MADQEIEFKVTADVTDAKQGFNEVQQSIDGMKGKSAEIAPVMDEAAGAMEKAGTAALGLSTKALVVTGIIGVSLIVALQTALPYIEDFVKGIQEAAHEAELYAKSLQGAINKMLEFQDERMKIKYPYTEKQLIGGIGYLESQLKEMEDDARRRTREERSKISQKGGAGIIGLSDIEYTAEEEKRKLKLEEVLKSFKDQKIELEAIKDLQGIMSELAIEGVSTEKDKTKEIKEQNKELKNQVDIILGAGKAGGYSKTEMAESPLSDYIKTLRGMKGGKGGKAESADLSRGFKEQMEFVNDLIRESASILRNEFITAWEDIFGEANSLFEKLLANMVSKLAELAATKLMYGFLDFLLPGMGSGLQMAYGATSTGTPIVINLGDEEVARVVLKGQKIIQNRRMF